MSIAKFSVKKPVTILMVVLVVLLLGSVSFSKLAVDLMPNIEMPIVAVMTSYEGAGPEEVEKTVTKMYESQLATIGGIDTISSTSSAGQSMIIMMFDYGTNLDEAVNSCRDKLGFVRDMMPDAVGTSTIVKMDMNSMPVMVLTVSGNRHIDDVRKIVDDELVPRLERSAGIAAVTVMGGNEPEINIVVDPLKLEAYGIGMDTIANVLRSENANNTGGSVVEGTRDTLVRITGEYKMVSEIADTNIPLKTGGSVRLGDLATVSEVNTEISAYSTLDGQPVVSVAIQKESDGNTVQVDKAVKSVLADLEGNLYEDIRIGYAFNQADYINVAISSVVSSAMYSALLAILVLAIFLRNVRSTLVIGMAIPLSVVGAFVLLFFDKQTLNMLTLGGLALGIGMMVDNAIVVLENIYRHRSMGKDKITAAIDGAQEVTGPVIASTLTTVAVFFPIVFVKGLSSEIFTPLALTIGFALLASLAVSLTFVPMVSSKILVLPKADSEYKGVRSWFHKLNNLCSRGFAAVDTGYSHVVRWALKFRKTVSFLVLLAMVGTLGLVPKVGMEFIPAQDAGQLNINVTLPNNTVIGETGAVAARISAIVEQVPEVDTIFASVGSSGGMMGGGGNSASFTVMLVPVNERVRGIDEVSKDIETKLGGIAGAEIEVYGSSMVMGSSDPISVALKGQDKETLAELADSVTAVMEGIEGIDRVESSLSNANEELNIVINRDRAAFYGVNSAQVYQSVSGALQGMKVSTFKSSSGEVDIKIKYPEEITNSLDKVKQLMVPSSTGGYVPIEEVASITYGYGQQSIARENQSRVVTVSASIYGRDLGSISQDLKLALDQMPKPLGYDVEFGGTSQEMVDSFKDLGLALVMAILLVYMVLASQFEGLLYPFIIMFSVPPTFIGVVLGLLSTGQTLNILSLIGVIMLAGIVVNNAIVLVDYINTLRNEYGMEKREAIIEAGRTRLRPILMTTLTTVMGMVPLLVSDAEGSELLAPLAATIIGGLSFSTIITLILVPVMYQMLDSMGSKFKSMINRRERKLEEGK